MVVASARGANVIPPSATAEPGHRRRTLVAGLALVSLLASACAGFEGDVLVAADGARGGAGAACPPIAQAILLLDRDGRLASYDPRDDVVRELASVAASVRPADCVAGEVAVALDRDGAAWILGCDGDLLRCDPSTGACAGGQARAALPASAHMAWAADASGAPSLFFAVPTGRGSPMLAPAASALLRFPDFETPVTSLAGWPALTGSKDRLWALFAAQAGRGGTPPRLVALDAASGREIEAREIGAAAFEPTPVLLTLFAGDFWVLQASSTSATRVQRVGGTGQGRDSPRTIPRRVAGAASSTCGS